MNNNALRAAVIALIQSIFPVLQVLGIAHFSGDDIAVLMLFVTNAVTLFFLVYKGAPQEVAVVGGAGLIIALALMGGSSKPVSAAVDCTVVNSIRVEVYDTDAEDPGTFVEVGGATVKFSPDPLDGVGTRTIVDNGDFDDSPVRGRIEVEEACAGSYSFKLSFNGAVANCDIAEDDAKGSNLEGDLVVEYEVDDCAVAPTPTPTATNTPSPSPTPQPTNTPAPTATAVPPTPIVIVVERPVTPAPVAPVIRPPSTGSGGLRAAWGDENDGASLFDSWCPGW